jgi:hypothetical protein
VTADRQIVTEITASSASLPRRHLDPATVGLTLHDGTGSPASVLPWQDLINRRGLQVAEGHPYGS